MAWDSLVRELAFGIDGRFGGETRCCGHGGGSAILVAEHAVLVAEQPVWWRNTLFWWRNSRFGGGEIGPAARSRGAASMISRALRLRITGTATPSHRYSDSESLAQRLRVAGTPSRRARDIMST